MDTTYSGRELNAIRPVLKKPCLGSNLITTFEVRQLHRQALQGTRQVLSNLHLYLNGEKESKKTNTHLGTAMTMPGLGRGCVWQPKAVVSNELRLDRFSEAHLEANSLGQVVY